MGLGLGFVDLDPLRPAALDELGGQAALAEAGFGRDPDDCALSRLCRLEPLLEHRQLLLAADEPGEAAFAGEVEPRARRADPLELIDPDRPARALDLELAEVVEVE